MTRLLAIAISLSKNRHAGEDILFETYAKLFRRWDNILDGHADSSGNVPIGIGIVAVKHMCYDFYKSAHKRAKREEQFFFLKQRSLSDGKSAEEIALQRELWVAVGELGPDMERLIFLEFVEGYSGRKAAKIIGWSEATYRRRRAEAMEILRARIEGDD